jgi:pilus assembly protein Flp/PilA
MKYRDETGASAVEYGLIVAAVAATIVTAVFVLGGPVLGLFTDSQATFQTCVDSGSC